MKRRRITLTFGVLSSVLLLLAVLLQDANVAANEPEEEPHPDLNEEDYDDMIFVGRFVDQDEETATSETQRRRRLTLNDVDDIRISFLFGSSLEHANATDADEEDFDTSLLHDTDPERQNLPKKLKPFGHMEVHEHDGGAVPPHTVQIDPFFLDTAPVTNKQFAKFVSSTYYETEAEQFGWSYVLASFVSSEEQEQHDTDPHAEHWVAVPRAYWRRPEGEGSSYKYREHHPVTHVSHRDAAEYCTWKGKRLPGEREYEAAARYDEWQTSTNSHRQVYAWGNASDWSVAEQYANLWGNGSFPWHNSGGDGWRGTSPIKTYPATGPGFFDLTGNVWEWMRGGKHKARIVRGASYVDSLDGSFNTAATLGARATVHGTTTSGHVGFRCAKSPKYRRTEHHWKWHDEEVHGTLAVEDEYGHVQTAPSPEQTRSGDDDEFDDYDDDEVHAYEQRRKRRKVVKKRERLSTEL